MNCAPKLSICSRTAGLVSKALTAAPIHLACTVAAKPATPPPTTSTRQGGTRPAAVICPVELFFVGFVLFYWWICEFVLINGRCSDILTKPAYYGEYSRDIYVCLLIMILSYFVLKVCRKNYRTSRSLCMEFFFFRFRLTCKTKVVQNASSKGVRLIKNFSL